ncbi:hypothetical protein DPMN_158111 [Dreissena polymorpha]|uniref:Uncharacterized protein n=1 Tax=Dreissena polymorpha TaxID=45954 RepID=A0A9D4EJ87_DREPO|nr:hypothetical protein DPMN_158111 [Dreissena polymorpha]
MSLALRTISRGRGLGKRPRLAVSYGTSGPPVSLALRTISRSGGLGRRSRLAGPRVPGLADHLSRPGSRKAASACGLVRD